MEERIKRIVADVSGHSAAVLVSTRDLRDYGIDSSRALEVLAECEDAFGFEIAEEAIPRLRTIADIASYVIARAEV